MNGEAGERSGSSLLAKVLIGALAAFGLVTLIGWVLSWLVGLVKFLVALVVLGALALWLLNSVGRSARSRSPRDS